jgi:hypothetical protein
MGMRFLFMFHFPRVDAIVFPAGMLQIGVETARLSTSARLPWMTAPRASDVPDNQLAAFHRIEDAILVAADQFCPHIRLEYDRCRFEVIRNPATVRSIAAATLAAAAGFSFMIQAKISSISESAVAV